MTLVPNSNAARDVAYHAHAQTNLKTHSENGPVVITRGDGVHVYDDAGKEYIEGFSGLWSAALGFNEKRLVEAAKRQMDDLPFYHTFNHKSHPAVIDLAEKLIMIAPVEMSKVIFQNSGSEAVDTAAKLVWYYHNAIGKPKKKKIIAREKAYHGTTVVAASLTGLERMHWDFDLPMIPVVRAGCPHFYKFAEDGESEEDFATRMAEDLEALILEEDPDTIGAMIAEPMQGAGGVIIPPATYFKKVQAVLKKYEILLIADEVICGFYRTGNLWGSQTFGLAPDMITCAKALSASYLPISAILVNEKIYQSMLDESGKLGIFAHGFTYSGHPVPAAVALEALRIYEERDFAGHVLKVGIRLQDGLNSLRDHALVGEVRGVGMVGAVELVKDKASKMPFDPALGVGAKANRIAEEDGLILRALGDAVGFCPPLIVDEETIDEIVSGFKIVLDKTYRWLQEESEI